MCVEQFSKINITLRKKCPYSEFFWSVFSPIQTKYGEVWNIFPYSVRMRENTDKRNLEYGHFSRSVRITQDHSKETVISH